MKEQDYISRKEQAAITKKKIFDTTLFLIRKKGYGKITIREICKSAEISIGTFYLYFLSKDDILLDLYNKLNQKLSKLSEDKPSCGVRSSSKEEFIFRVRSLFDLMEASFDRELLSEILRALLLLKRDPLLNEGQPFCEGLLSLIKTMELKPDYKESLSPEQILKETVVLIRGHIFGCVIEDERPLSFAKSDCLKDLDALFERLLA